ncbi:MAG: cold-shock protein [Acidimicrobiales bacterium]
MRAGRVAEFDEERGLGVVVGDDGRAYPFHCTALADGSRTTRPGTRVRFAVRPGAPGVWEAAEVTAAG